MGYSIVVTLFIASIGILRIQAQFESLPLSDDDKRYLAGLIKSQEYKDYRNGVKRNYNGANITFGSVTISKNNTYGPNAGKTRYGSQDIFINNVFPDNPNGTNNYAPVLIEENNTYKGKNESTQYEPIVTKIGNIYPDNPGKNDIHNPIVIRKNNIYLDEEVHPDKKSLNESKSNEKEKVQNNTENHASSAENSKPDSVDGEKFNSHVILPSSNNPSSATIRNEEKPKNITKHQAYSSEDILYESKSNEKEKVQNNREDHASSAEDRAFNNQPTSPTDINDYIQNLLNEDIARDDTKSKPDSVDGEKFNSHVTLPSSNNPSSTTIRNEEKPKNITKHHAYLSDDSLYNKQPSLSFDKSVYYFLYISILYSLFYNK